MHSSRSESGTLVALTLLSARWTATLTTGRFDQFDLQIFQESKKFWSGPFEQTPQDLKRAARARAKMKPKFLFWWRARARGAF